MAQHSNGTKVTPSMDHLAPSLKATNTQIPSGDFYANTRREGALVLFPLPLLVGLRVIPQAEIDDFLKLFCETFTDYFLTGAILGMIIASSHSLNHHKNFHTK